MTRRRRLEMPRIVEMATSTAKLCDVLMALAPEVPAFMAARAMIESGLQQLTDQEQRDAGGGK